MLALRTLEFDRIVEVVRACADAARRIGAGVAGARYRSKVVAAALNATGETTAYLESNALFPLRAGAGSTRRWTGSAWPGRSSIRCPCGASPISSIRWSSPETPCGRRRRRFRSSTASSRARPASRTRSPRFAMPSIRGARCSITRARCSGGSATTCGRNASGCGRRSISSCAARTRRSTCRSRSSPSETAATC